MRLPRFHFRHFSLTLALCCTSGCTLSLSSFGFSQAQDKPAGTAEQAKPQQPVLSPELDKTLREGWSLYTKHQDEASREKLERAVKLAQDEKSAWGEGEAHRILGLVALQEAKYPASKEELVQALALFQSESWPWSVALTHKHLGAVSNYMGQYAEAVDYYRKALAEFEQLHDVIDEAHVLQGLMFIDALPLSKRREYAEQGLKLARQTGDKGLIGNFLHSMGDHLFTSGDYAGAIEKLNEAAALLEQAGDRVSLARVWTSLGRLYRVHGAFDDAIASYKKGLSIEQELDDQMGVIQSLNALAISYQYSRRTQESMEYYERALKMARETGSSRVIGFMAGNVGNAYCETPVDYGRGIALLEESLHLDPTSSNAPQRYSALGMCFSYSGDNARALEAIQKAVSLNREGGNSEYLAASLQNRAYIYWKLNQLPEALADIQEAIGVEEKTRARLMPADYLKQGFGESAQNLFSLAVQIHEQLGQHKEAMVVAEQARARAFLDLLASRGMGQVDKQRADLTVANASTSAAPPEKVPQEEKKDADSAGLRTRGSNALLFSGAKGTMMLASGVSAAAPTFDELVSTAKRLNSTLLSYWVMPDATYAWILKPDGAVQSQKIAVSSEQLSKMISATSYQKEEPQTSPTVSAAEAKSEAQTRKVAATRGGQTLRLRGGGELVLNGKKEQVWRELYKLLVLPLRDSLPPRESHLTIVPQGPLFRLSFAALRDEQGHYLIENYAINYAPSLGILRLTGEQKQQLGHREPSYLIVADPQIAPDLAKDPRLPSLPGARNEARNLLRLLPGGQTTLLMGAEASKAAVREHAPGKTVLHLATHAIVSDDQPFDSFLVLSAGNKSPPSDARLSVKEIYNLDLHADLVVLSACRTALGKLSGDGIAGLTRAFFYGGTPSVMATMWDVADEPTSFLITDFYKSLKENTDKSQALRAAQLRLVRQLRAGRIKVNTPVGSIALPEDPVFWAGFVLQGEP